MEILSKYRVMKEQQQKKNKRPPINVLDKLRRIWNNLSEQWRYSLMSCCMIACPKLEDTMMF